MVAVGTVVVVICGVENAIGDANGVVNGVVVVVPPIKDSSSRKESSLLLLSSFFEVFVVVNLLSIDELGFCVFGFIVLKKKKL